MAPLRRQRHRRGGIAKAATVEDYDDDVHDDDSGTTAPDTDTATPE